MAIEDVCSFAAGAWVEPCAQAREIRSAVSGEVIYRAGNSGLDVAGMLEYARGVGGPALRALTFHDRAKMLKAVAGHLEAHKDVLYALSFETGATQADHRIDIDGGIGTLFVYASKGRRELPAAQVFLDGTVEGLSKGGTFVGQHICTPLQGVAVHINAFNFPVWGMLEKLAPAILAGVPCIVKPATATCYVTEAAIRLILEAGILPEGALQMVSGGLGDMLGHVGGQDVVSFTGSAQTARQLRAVPNILENAVRFVAEQDSLNATVLGSDIECGSVEFAVFLDEIVSEMTTKAGQKCTAIRRVLVPEALCNAVIEGLVSRLETVTVGDPRDAETSMGALVSQAQKRDVLGKVARFEAEATRVYGDPSAFDGQAGAFVSPVLFRCDNPDRAQILHEEEAFGPVATVMPYRDVAHACALLNRGGGSLVASCVTNDPAIARELVMQSASHHGRLYFNNAQSMGEATGHGSPLPHMVHGGPGRAGGGEELGGIRGVMHYMQRTAIQGSPDLIAAIGQTWVPGAQTHEAPAHPFTRNYHALALGETLQTEARQITQADIDYFAEFTGDTFYGHTDEAAAQRNPFFPGRVAHGYLILSFAAGLFVEPNEGPVLANTGLEDLQFLKPVSPGDWIKVALTVKQKTPRAQDYGQVRWHVAVSNQEDVPVATYTLLTMNAYA